MLISYTLYKIRDSIDLDANKTTKRKVFDYMNVEDAIRAKEELNKDRDCYTGYVIEVKHS